MDGIRVVLIGGTSNVGKSTVGTLLADALHFEYRSTDALAKHPGRPWRAPGREVPKHVVQHYQSLGVDELMVSVLDHYEGLWPCIEELITHDAARDDRWAGLVLEGSALWPTRVAKCAAPHIAAVWLTGHQAVVRKRVLAASGYGDATMQERYLIDKFLDRALRYQALLIEAVDRLGMNCIDVGERSPAQLVDTLLGIVHAPLAAGPVERHSPDRNAQSQA